jgi:lambda family phage portal protein
MISGAIDRLVNAFNPVAGLRRQQARKILSRSYSGAEPHRLNSQSKPMNRSADKEAEGPFGADQLRAWARMLVRDNAYAWGVVDTIVSSVVGRGIQTMSDLPDADDINEQRDELWQEWCKVCDINGQLDWHSMQSLVQREMVEAGEVLVHMVSVSETDRGIRRPVPFALELIEADRLAVEHSTLRAGKNGNEIIRGVEVDELGKPVAYHVYKTHPADYYHRREVVRLPASNVLHLYRKDRVGQTRGVSWFAPVVSWLRDLGVYLENEMVASAIAACYTAAIKSRSPISMLNPETGQETADSVGNLYDFMQPGQIMHLHPDEDITFGNAGRPNADAGTWINLILRGIAVGTGLSFETIARDYSYTSWSSNRASQLEDRRRFRCWQMYLEHRLCDPVWMRFCEKAALVGSPAFPSLVELLDNPKLVPSQNLATGWEWVDPKAEGDASAAAIYNNLSTVRDELGKKGQNWRKVLMQRQKETELMEELGLVQTGARLRSVTESENVSESKSNTQVQTSVESKSISGSSENIAEVEDAFEDG